MSNVEVIVVRKLWCDELIGMQWKFFWVVWIGYLLDGFDFVMIMLVFIEIGRIFYVGLVVIVILVFVVFIV